MRWDDVLPLTVAREQAKWELWHRVKRARDQGAKLAEIGNVLHLSVERVRHLHMKAIRSEGRRSPVQIYLEGWPLPLLTRDEIACNLREMAERKKKEEWWETERRRRQEEWDAEEKRRTAEQEMFRRARTEHEKECEAWEEKVFWVEHRKRYEEWQLTLPENPLENYEESG